MTLLGFKTILHKKCRSGKNSEGPAENSWVLDQCPAKWKQISKSLRLSGPTSTSFVRFPRNFVEFKIMMCELCSILDFVFHWVLPLVCFFGLLRQFSMHFVIANSPTWLIRSSGNFIHCKILIGRCAH
jgi:hypothetical protein